MSSSAMGSWGSSRVLGYIRTRTKTHLWYLLPSSSPAMVMSQRRYAVWQNKLQQKVEAEAQAKAAQEAEAAHAEAAAQQAEAAAQAEAAQSLLLLREQEPWAPQEHDSLFARQDFLSLDVLPVQHEKSFRLNVGQHPEDVFAAVERDFLDEFEASFAAVERDFGGVEQADGGVDHAATNYRDGLNQAGQDERDQLYTALSEFTARKNRSSRPRLDPRRRPRDMACRSRRNFFMCRRRNFARRHMVASNGRGTTHINQLASTTTPNRRGTTHINQPANTRGTTHK